MEESNGSTETLKEETSKLNIKRERISGRIQLFFTFDIIIRNNNSNTVISSNFIVAGTSCKLAISFLQ